MIGSAQVGDVYDPIERLFAHAQIDALIGGRIQHELDCIGNVMVREFVLGNIREKGGEKLQER
jgi:hypothetical protein